MKYSLSITIAQKCKAAVNANILYHDACGCAKLAHCVPTPAASAAPAAATAPQPPGDYIDHNKSTSAWGSAEVRGDVKPNTRTRAI